MGLKEKEIVGQYAAVKNDLMRRLLQEENKTELKIYADNKESYFEKQNIEIAMRPTGEKEKRYIG